MFFFILFILMLGVAVALFGVARSSGDSIFNIGAAVSLGVALVMLGLSTFVIVPTRQVGIPITFGVTGQPLPNGASLKAPWTNVELMDTTVQIDDNLGDKRTEVRLGNQNVAFVQNQVRWAVIDSAASSLFNAHRDFDRIGPAIEEPEIAAALSSVLSTYDPMDPNRKSNEQIATEVKEKMTVALGDRLEIIEVKVIKIDFDALTQSRLDALLAEQGNTRIAEQKMETAAKEAEANRIIADSVSHSPNVVTMNCIKEIAAADAGKFPAGFQCWPNTDGSIVIPAGK